MKSPVAWDPKSCCFSVKKRVKVMMLVLTSELPPGLPLVSAMVYGAG